MRYCAKCIIPDSRPHIQMDREGVCNACRSHAKKHQIDWDQRRQLFGEIVAWAKSVSKGYDCVIPVSGGKDSTWQVVKCLEAGLNALAITWKSPSRNSVGARNLANLVQLGVDHIDYQINPKVERKFLYQALVQCGSTAIPMHMAIFNIPLKIAVKFSIPLVVWGENSASEYGGREDDLQGFKMDIDWVKRYGAIQGTGVSDWISTELSEKELTAYKGPTADELNRSGLRAIFLGSYFNWDPEESFKEAKKHGFQERKDGPKTGIYNYADIDDDFISVHHYLKWYKFGITRTFDNLSIEIRNGRITRERAIELLRDRGDETPHEDIEKLCDFLGVPKKQFFDLIEKFRNPDLWGKKNGHWQIKDFLIEDWRWT